MPAPRVVKLSEAQERELRSVVAHDPTPYMRTKAAAILKVAHGESIVQVARHGLLKVYDDNTVRQWINRYLGEGLAGLQIRSGRGRKPAFFPYGAGRGPGSCGLARTSASLSSPRRT